MCQHQIDGLGQSCRVSVPPSQRLGNCLSDLAKFLKGDPSLGAAEPGRLAMTRRHAGRREIPLRFRCRRR